MESESFLLRLALLMHSRDRLAELFDEVFASLMAMLLLRGHDGNVMRLRRVPRRCRLALHIVLLLTLGHRCLDLGPLRQ